MSPCKKQVCGNELLTNWNEWSRCGSDINGKAESEVERRPMPSLLLVNRHCGFIATFNVHFQSHSPFFEGSVSLCSSDWPGTDPAAMVSRLLGQHQCTAKLPVSRPSHYSEFLNKIFLCTVFCLHLYIRIMSMPCACGGQGRHHVL